jgi:hypothetical protein
MIPPLCRTATKNAVGILRWSFGIMVKIDSSFKKIVHFVHIVYIFFQIINTLSPKKIPFLGFLVLKL